MPDRKTVTVQRENVILQVPEEWVDRYLDQGYCVIDRFGNVIKASIPTDLGLLQKAYVEHTQKIAELEKQIQELQQKPVEQLPQKKTGRQKKQ